MVLYLNVEFAINFSYDYGYVYATSLAYNNCGGATVMSVIEVMTIKKLKSYHGQQ